MRVVLLPALLGCAFVLPIEQPSLGAQQKDVVFHAESNPILVRMKNNPDPQVLSGFIVNGEEAQIAVVEAAAAKDSLTTSRIDDPSNGGPLEVMVFFVPPFDHAVALDLFHRAQRAEFGTKVEGMIEPLSQYRSDGGLTADAVKKASADNIVD